MHGITFKTMKGEGNTMKPCTHAIVILCVFAAMGSAFAQDQGPGPATDGGTALSPVPTRPAGFHRHDGFFGRLLLGSGWSGASLSKHDNTYRSRGFTTMSELALGWSVIENLALSLNSFGGIQWNSRVKIEGGGLSDPFPVRRLLMGGLGPGVTYAFMPLNLYLAAALGISYLVITREKVQEGVAIEPFDPGVGFGAELVLGKEWWVSDNWALGVAASGTYLRVPDDDAWWNLWNAALMFTVTYN